MPGAGECIRTHELNIKQDKRVTFGQQFSLKRAYDQNFFKQDQKFI